MSSGDSKSAEAAAMAPELEMTAEQIEYFKRTYESNAMETFISREIKGNSTAAKEVRKATAVLAKLSVLKDSAESVQNQYGRLYRWIWQGVTKQDGGIRLASMKAEDCSSWKWVMQLNIKGLADNSQAEWVDWVSVRPSELTNRINLGLFAERDFPVGSTIGYFTGKITWRADEAGTAEPTDAYLASQGVENSPCGSAFRNTEAVFVVADPTMVSSKEDADKQECLYMGIHYINSPELVSQAFSRDAKANCRIYADGSVMTTGIVSAGTELLEILNPIETPDTKKRKMDDSSSEE